MGGELRGLGLEGGGGGVVDTKEEGTSRGFIVEYRNDTIEIVKKMN